MADRRFMYAGWTLFRLELKKYIVILPVILAETVLSGLILLGIVFCASKAIYGEKAVGEIKVGIVTQGEERLTEMLVRFVESMDSAKDTVSFVRMSEKEAREALGLGELSAAILVPEGIVDSINSGENIPATVLLADDYSRAETEVFTQFTEAGAKLLTVAQAGIYAADALCVEEGHPEWISQSENYLNREYLDYAMGRSSLFKEVEVSAANGISLADYYKISLLLAFLSFAGLSFGKSMRVQTGDREKMFIARGMSTGKRYLIETAAFGCVFALLGTVFGSFLTFGAGWLWLWSVWFSMGIFLRLLFQVTGNRDGGVLLCFGILMSFMLTSGVFIPAPFLPLQVEKVGKCLPYKSWMEILTAISQNNYNGKLALKLTGMVFLFLAAGCLAALIREKRKEKESFLWRKAQTAALEKEQEMPKAMSLGREQEVLAATSLGREQKILAAIVPGIKQKVQILGILWKQYLKIYGLGIILIFLATFLFRLGKESFFEEEEYSGIAVGICTSDEKGKELLSGLLREEGIFRFEGYENEEEMLRQIKNGSLECGYFFPEGFYDRLVSGKRKRQAILYYSPASSVHRITGEVVFAELFSLLSEDVLDGVLRELGYGEDAEFALAGERLHVLNEKYAGDGSTFHFIYEAGDGESSEEPENMNTARGLVAVMIFLMSLLGLGNTLEKEAIWRAMPGGMGKWLRAGSLHVAVMGSVLAGGAALWISGNTGKMGKELAGLLVYFIALEIFMMVLRLFIRSTRVLYGFLPSLILCCCLFCPVFIKIERYFPQIAWAADLLPVTYYLEMF